MIVACWQTSDLVFFNIEKHGSAFLYFFFFFQVGAFIVRQ